MPFHIGNEIYDSQLIIAYINLCKPKITKIPMSEKIIEQNLLHNEWYNAHGKNGFSILDVINNKKVHAKHYQRMINANVNYPIVIWKEKKLVIDGNHRLGHAFINDHEYIKTVIVDNAFMKKILLGTFRNKREFDEVIASYKLHDYIELFVKKFCK